jgi:hypothetical protein
MPTEIVFGGGHSVRVLDAPDSVRRQIEDNGEGRPLLKFDLAGGGNREIFLNSGCVAYIREVTPGDPGRVRSAGQTITGDLRDAQL